MTRTATAATAPSVEAGAGLASVPAPRLTRSQVARLGGLAVHKKRGPGYARHLARRAWKVGNPGRPRLRTYDEIAATAEGRRLIRRLERMVSQEPAGTTVLRSSHTGKEGANHSR